MNQKIFSKNFRYLKGFGFPGHLIFGYFGGGFSLPYISRINTAYIGEDSSIWMVPEMFGDQMVGHDGGESLGIKVKNTTNKSKSGSPFPLSPLSQEKTIRLRTQGTVLMI